MNLGLPKHHHEFFHQSELRFLEGDNKYFAPYSVSGVQFFQVN